MKVDTWEVREKLLNVGGFILWFVVMLLLITFKVQKFFGLIYLVYTIFFLVVDRFLRCTRCYYYGTQCNCFGGKLASSIFRPQENKAEKLDDTMAAIMFGGFIIFPLVVFLVFGGAAGYNPDGTDALSWVSRIVFSIVQVILAGCWFVIHKKTACAVCKNRICPLCEPEE